MFLNYIHRCRGVAIVFIVAGHCIRFFSWENSPLIEKVCKAIFQNGTVIFVFIAGFLFQHLLYKYTYKQYLINKLKYIILPYFIVSIPMITYLVFVEGLGHWTYPDLNEKSYLFQIVWFYLTGKHLAPLWFIPMISLHYLLFPFLLLIDKKVEAYFFILPVAITISAIVHRPIAEINVIHTFIYFFSVYLLGMAFSRFKTNILPIIDKLTLWLILLVVTLFFIEIFFYDHAGIIYVNQIFYHESELVDINLFQKLIICCLLIHFLKKYEDFFNKPVPDRIFKNLAELSFGIYFSHYYFLELHFKTKRIFQYELEGDIIKFITSVIIVGTISIILLNFIRNITGNRSRYLIGC